MNEVVSKGDLLLVWPVGSLWVLLRLQFLWPEFVHADLDEGVLVKDAGSATRRAQTDGRC
jgi:hypothetical protein